MNVITTSNKLQRGVEESLLAIEQAKAEGRLAIVNRYRNSEPCFPFVVVE